MVMRCLLLVALAGGCFHPMYDHPRCGPNDECPSGLACNLTSHQCEAPGGGDDAGRDAGDDGAVDASPDAGIPANITISGTVRELTTTSGMNPLPNVRVDLFKGTTQLASMMSDANGAYSFSVATGGMPVDGYIVGTRMGFKETYVYAAKPATADQAGVPVTMMTPSTFQSFGTVAGISQDPLRGWMTIGVANGTGQAAVGATISLIPAGGAVRYADANGLPSSSLMSISTSGIVFIFNLPTGNVTVSATGGGVPMFYAHMVNVRADKLTFTGVQPF